MSPAFATSASDGRPKRITPLFTQMPLQRTTHSDVDKRREERIRTLTSAETWRRATVFPVHGGNLRRPYPGIGFRIHPRDGATWELIRVGEFADQSR